MASQVKVGFHGVYPQKRRQRKRSCRRFRRCAGAVECIAEYKKIKQASPLALWVSGSSRAQTYAKGVAIREHTELQTLPRRPVSIIGTECYAMHSPPPGVPSGRASPDAAVCAWWGG